MARLQGLPRSMRAQGQTAATFDGTSYVTLNNLTLSNQMGHVIWMVNGAEYITVNGCKILGDTVGTSSTTGTPIADFRIEYQSYEATA